jgi:quinol monooxygenase YgiN
MAFIQVIEFRSGKIDDFRKLEDEWGDRITAEMTARRSILAEDRDQPGRYFQIVFFDSYESAMQNSDRPVTKEFAERMHSIADGEPNFFNLDVVDERSW